VPEWGVGIRDFLLFSLLPPARYWKNLAMLGIFIDDIIESTGLTEKQINDL